MSSFFIDKLIKDRISVIFGIFAVAFVSLAIVGSIRGYSPVPFWDMWMPDGYLGFYLKASSGDWTSWWARHNEHRIPLARLFFWIDLRWFDGQGWFLLGANHFLMALAGALFWIIYKDQVTCNFGENRYIAFFLLAWLFSWCQEENFTWGFQVQAILAQLIPLAAFFALYRAVPKEGDVDYFFAIAVAFGILAIGTMANGVLTLPLMTLYALVVRMDYKRIMVLLLLSLGALLLLFYDYESPGRYAALSREMMKDSPIQAIHYLLLYLGGPFYWIFGKGILGTFLALTSAGFLIGSVLVFAAKAIRCPQENTLDLSLLMFVLYIGGTAFGTMSGRLVFGVEQALSSRYTTPVLMAWAAVLALYLPYLKLLDRALAGRLWVFFSMFLLFMLPEQLRALTSQQDRLFERLVASLALELNVRDEIQINHIAPSVDEALSVAKIASVRNMSIFHSPPIRDIHKTLDKRLLEIALPMQQNCRGSLDEVYPISGESKYLGVRGWIFNLKNRVTPEMLYLVDNQGIVKGAALIGQRRPDVASTVDVAAVGSGFKGYILSDVFKQTSSKLLTLIDPKTGCRLLVTPLTNSLPA